MPSGVAARSAAWSLNYRNVPGPLLPSGRPSVSFDPPNTPLRVNAYIALGAYDELDRSAWSVSASDNSEDAYLAVDNDITTRWTTTAFQTPGQYFIVDMGSVRTFNRIVLDAGDSTTDYPRGYQILVSNDGFSYGLVTSGQGTGSVVTAIFPQQTARYIEIIQTGSSSTSWWSIHELRVYGNTDWTSWNWTDITPYVRHNPGVTATTGRADESSRVDPGSASLTLDNSDGRFSRLNPASPYSGELSRNTPILVTIDPGNGTYDAVQMFVNEWPTRFNRSRSDVTVPIKCAGVLRRLAQGEVSKSPIRRFYETATPQPLAYWPLEDASGAVEGTSAVVGVRPLVASGGSSASSGVLFAQGDQGRTQPVYTGYEISQVGTDPVVSLNQGGSLAADLPSGVSSPIEWSVHFVARVYGYTGIAGSDVVLARWLTPGGTFVKWEVLQSSFTGHPQVVGYDSAGAATVLVDHNFAAIDMAEYRVGAWQIGSDVLTQFWIVRTQTETVAGQLGVVNSDIRAGTLARPSRIIVNPNHSTVETNPISASENLTNGYAFGHLSVWDSYTIPSITDFTVDPYTGKNISAWTGYAGENAIARITRLCEEERLPLQVTGWTWNMAPTALGIQPTESFLGLLRDAEAADGGVLYENGFGLGYQPLIARYNAPVGLDLDFDNAEVAEPPEPTDDDQNLRNSWTISRAGGSSATVRDEDNIATEGLYDDSDTINLFSDSQTEQVASWLVHLGTNPEYRWPQLSLDFTSESGRQLIEQWTQLQFGSRLRASNPPDQVLTDPIDAFIEGKTEFFNTVEWAASLNTTPALPYEVHQVEAADNRGRVDSAASTLASDATSGATTISVAVSDGALWRTGAVTFDIGVGGERMTVTNISGGSSPQTFTVTRSVNGIVKAQTIGTKVSLWRPGVYAR